MEKDRTYFRYIGNVKEPDGHSGIITVASKADFETGRVRLGLSFCSPDDTFLRWKGRTIAEGRLQKHPIVINFKSAPREAINKFLCALVLNNQGFCDTVESLPEKAAKHFPLRWPWFQHFDLPFLVLRSIEGGAMEYTCDAVAPPSGDQLTG